MSWADCTLSGCGRRHYARGYCRAHHARWRRHGDPLAVVPIGAGRATGTSYRSACRRVRTVRGPATEQSCAECGAPAVVWSYDGTDPDARTDAQGRGYSLDPGRYRSRCRSCQRRASGGRAARVGAVMDVERAARLYRGGATARGIGAVLGQSPGAVLGALRAHGVPIRAPARARR